MKKTLLLFALSIAFYNIYSQSTLSASLSACYALDGNANDPVNALSGTLSAVTPTVDRMNASNSAYYFNGASHITLPNDPLLKPADAISFSLWIKPENTGPAHIVYTRNNLGSNFEAFQLAQYISSPIFRLNKSSSQGNDIALSTTTITPFTWYHIVGTIDNSDVKLYINGVLEDSTPSTYSGFDYMTGKNVLLGATTEFFDYPFVGSMDNVRFYNRTLTQQEVTDLFNTDPLCIELGPPPVANFSVSATEVCRGKVVTFADLSTNTPTAWAWQVTPSVGPAPAAIANPTFSFPAGGIYTITLVATNSVGISNTASQVVFVSECTTISETSAIEIRVFPNPVNDFLEIKNGENLKSFFVTDISGKIISIPSQTIFGDSKVDFRSLSSGLYFLVLETNSGTQSLKVLKE